MYDNGAYDPRRDHNFPDGSNATRRRDIQRRSYNYYEMWRVPFVRGILDRFMSHMRFKIRGSLKINVLQIINNRAYKLEFKVENNHCRCNNQLQNSYPTVGVYPCACHHSRIRVIVREDAPEPIQP